MKGEFVKKILDEKGISQAQVSKKLGVSPQLLNQMLKAEDIKTGVLENIANASGLTLGDFLCIENSNVQSGENIHYNSDNIIETLTKANKELVEEIHAMGQRIDKLIDKITKQ